MVVPVGKRVRLLITANDVLHSWWVPALGAKQDAIPGFIRDSWFKADKIGTYRGQCVELCGKDHGFMPIVVEVVSEEDYKAWVAKSGPRNAAADDAKLRHRRTGERGEQVYRANCAACRSQRHGPPGTFRRSTVPRSPPARSPSISGGAARPASTTAMAAFGGQLSDADIAAVVTYQRNAWDNKMGDRRSPPRSRWHAGAPRGAAMRTGR
jgi:cytochrome c oxidase subunit 2